MRIGVVSDTHLSGTAVRLPDVLVEGLQGVDMILHAGDWMDESVVGLFASIAPVDGVAGNNDGLEIVRRFGRRKVLKLAGYRIGIVHGDGGRSTPDTAHRAFLDSDGQGTVDVVLFGHSHIPFMERRSGMLLFNPGSPTDKRRQARYSYGIVTLGSQPEAELFYYERK
ncbi:hypothetical protein PAESOLCIP111_04924 [Paenibacillus solanacearum]|uniref:Phosphoesterase n=1 Tax=Paenibacillus solanacearum TaxID=2048548 RepID=A0A916K562_9BACL|nr:metallophosphoesterase [Paenibacillus solanacearum]CAG7645339.1 hypothetical protein PAESOLCIP111_04924 [Paenibacillus solanacearum]